MIYKNTHNDAIIEAKTKLEAYNYFLPDFPELHITDLKMQVKINSESAEEVILPGTVEQKNEDVIKENHPIKPKFKRVKE
jgi:hypothetical protein